MLKKCFSRGPRVSTSPSPPKDNASPDVRKGKAPASRRGSRGNAGTPGTGGSSRGRRGAAVVEEPDVATKMQVRRAGNAAVAVGVAAAVARSDALLKKCYKYLLLKRSLRRFPRPIFALGRKGRKAKSLEEPQNLLCLHLSPRRSFISERVAYRFKGNTGLVLFFTRFLHRFVGVGYFCQELFFCPGCTPRRSRGSCLFPP